MKFLFVLQYPGYLRYFDSVVEALSGRGHQVAVAFDQPHKQPEGLAALDGMNATVEVLGRTPIRPDVWAAVARGVRGTIDYARYLHPRFASSPYLRDRMRKALPPPTRFLGRWDTSTADRTARLIAWLGTCERVIPSSPVIESFLRRVHPDVVVVSPLVTDQCPQVDLIKAARRVGVRTALCVASWDHLTTKGLMRIQPDLVAVWNHEQRREAIDFHGVCDERIIVTGAQCFDRWFDRTPRRSREAFCQFVGLRPDRPFVVFVGSTASISAPDAEVRFIRRWIEAVRCGPGSLGDVGILIRPHPYNAAHWGEVELTAYPNVVVFPRHGANPVDNDDRADYYDTLHHGVAVVGINTSAMIEAGIQDRPVFTIVDSSFDDTQTGTLHFRYLLPENGGHLQRAADLDEHTRQLAAAIDDGQAPPSRRFIETFVRPHGIDVAATPRLVVALEGLRDAVPQPADTLPVHLLPLRAALWTMGVLDRVRPANVRRTRRRFRKASHQYALELWRYYKTQRKDVRKWLDRRRKLRARRRKLRARPDDHLRRMTGQRTQKPRGEPGERAAL